MAWDKRTRTSFAAQTHKQRRRAVDHCDPVHVRQLTMVPIGLQRSSVSIASSVPQDLLLDNLTLLGMMNSV